MVLNHLENFHECFPKASQNWTVARNLTSPFDVIFFKFPYGNGVAKPVVSYSKVKLFCCCFTENDCMMSRVRQMLFGAQFADLTCFI